MEWVVYLGLKMTSLGSDPPLNLSLSCCQTLFFPLYVSSYWDIGAEGSKGGGHMSAGWGEAEGGCRPS